MSWIQIEFICFINYYYYFWTSLPRSTIMYRIHFIIEYAFEIIVELTTLYISAGKRRVYIIIMIIRRIVTMTNKTERKRKREIERERERTRTKWSLAHCLHVPPYTIGGKELEERVQLARRKYLKYLMRTLYLFKINRLKFLIYLNFFFKSNYDNYIMRIYII